MWAARKAARRPEDLANGPGKACEAMGIEGAHNGVDLTSVDKGITVVDDGVAPPSEPTTGPRVGISVAVDEPWRFSLPASSYRSRPMPSP